MQRIALTGPMYAGKTTLARALERQGYYVINFSTLLKEYALSALAACGVLLTLDDIVKRKHVYRHFLQELGCLIGFDDQDVYVHEALQTWRFGGMPEPVVFDNVRTLHQFEVLRTYGFQLVELHVDAQTQEARASALGVGVHALRDAHLHPIERGLCRPDLVSLHLDAREPVKTLVDRILNHSTSTTSAA